MKLTYSELSSPIILEEGKVVTLVIESAVLFRQFLNELMSQVNNDNGNNFILSKDDKLLQVKKEIEIIFNPLTLDFNQKKIITKIINDLSKVADGEMFFTKTLELKSLIIQYSLKLLDNLEIPISIDADFTIGELLKIVGTKIDIDTTNLIEKILTYFQIIVSLKLASVFVLINVKSYLSIEELIELYKYIEYNKYRVLLLESNSNTSIRHLEQMVLIDKDMCEIINDFI